jgi:hypothetical protein
MAEFSSPTGSWVEDRIRTGKDTGLDHVSSRAFSINQAWLSVVMLAVDLLAWNQRLLLDGDPARAEPKTQRWLLHVAARLTRGQRRPWVRTRETWPWAAQLAAGLRPAPRGVRPDRLTWPQTPRDNAG